MQQIIQSLKNDLGKTLYKNIIDVAIYKNIIYENDALIDKLSQELKATNQEKHVDRDQLNII